MSSKIEKIKSSIKILRKELEKIGNMYNEDGTIDPSEQQHLDFLMGMIAQCEQKLNDLIFAKSKSRLPENSVSNSEDKDPELVYEKFGGSTYTVKKGDYLQKIAKKIYGNRLFWPLIRDANQDKVKDNGNFVLVGAVLEIPEIQIAVATSGQNQSEDNQVTSIPAVPQEDTTGGNTPAVEDTTGGNTPVVEDNVPVSGNTPTPNGNNNDTGKDDKEEDEDFESGYTIDLFGLYTIEGSFPSKEELEKMKDKKKLKTKGKNGDIF